MSTLVKFLPNHVMYWLFQNIYYKEKSMKHCQLISILTASALLFSSASAFAQNCTTTPVYQPDSTRPALSGRLVYHSYSTYGDSTSKLYLFDFQTSQLSVLSNSWGITDPMNANFSPDGKWITFMGIQNAKWHVFLWQVGSSTLPANLTALSDTRNEDPKFSFDGKKIAFKRNGDIKIATINFSSTPPAISSILHVTSNGFQTEESMPYMTPSGKYVLYTRGANTTFDIYRTNLQNMTTQALISTPDVADYYPIVRDSTSFFYSRWDNATNKFDLIYMNVPNTNSNIQLKLNHCSSNNSDAAPVDEDLLIFSGTREGRYKLYLGDIKTGNVWSLDSLGINSMTNNVLGANYTYRR